MGGYEQDMYELLWMGRSADGLPFEQSPDGRALQREEQGLNRWKKLAKSTMDIKNSYYY